MSFDKDFYDFITPLICRNVYLSKGRVDYSVSSHGQRLPERFKLPYNVRVVSLCRDSVLCVSGHLVFFNEDGFGMDLQHLKDDVSNYLVREEIITSRTYIQDASPLFCVWDGAIPKSDWNTMEDYEFTGTGPQETFRAGIFELPIRVVDRRTHTPVTDLRQLNNYMLNFSFEHYYQITSHHHLLDPVDRDSDDEPMLVEAIYYATSSVRRERNPVRLSDLVTEVSAAYPESLVTIVIFACSTKSHQAILPVKNNTLPNYLNLIRHMRNSWLSASSCREKGIFPPKMR